MSLDGYINCPDCMGVGNDCMTCDGDGVVTQISDASGPLVDSNGEDLLPQLNQKRFRRHDEIYEAVVADIDSKTDYDAATRTRAIANMFAIAMMAEYDTVEGQPDG